MDLHLVCNLQKSEDPPGEPPYLARNTLRGRPMDLNFLTTNRWRLPLPPRQLPLQRGQTRGQRRMSRIRHAFLLRNP